MASRRSNIAALIFLALAASGCATSASLRLRPLVAGKTKVYPASEASTLLAMRQAFDESGIHLDTVENMDSVTTMLLGTHGWNLISYGEVVRVVISPAPAGSTAVRVISARRVATDIVSSGDVSEALFGRMDRILGRPDAPAATVAHPQRDSTSVESRTIGQRVRVSAPDVHVFQSIGVLGALTGDSVVLLGEPYRRVAIPRTAVRVIEVSRGRVSRVGPAVAVGVLAGAVAGAAVAAANTHDPCAQPQGCFVGFRGEPAVWGGLLGAAVGALGGMLVGSALSTERWELVPLDRVSDVRVGVTPLLGSRLGVVVSVAF